MMFKPKFDASSFRLYLTPGYEHPYSIGWGGQSIGLVRPTVAMPNAPKPWMATLTFEGQYSTHWSDTPEGAFAGAVNGLKAKVFCEI
jgi:hypothetical protein